MGGADGYWVELADRVWARRYTELDLTVGLVAGAERALVVDTRGDRGQGAELAAAVRAVTPLPVTVVLTHAHFDHCFGTCSFPGTPVYAHPRCAAAIADTAEAQRAEWTAYYREHGDPATATALASTVIVPPSELVERASLELGGRAVLLEHPGPGHTDHDLVAHVPDAGVVFAGDLVEQGAPPDFTDAHPLRWPAAVATIAALDPDTIVPGHGDPVPPSYLDSQRAELTVVAELCRRVLAGECSEADAVTASPYPSDPTRTALARAHATAGPRG